MCQRIVSSRCRDNSAQQICLAWSALDRGPGRVAANHLSARGIRTYLLFNFDSTNINDDQYPCNEIDALVDHTIRFGHFGIAPGFIHYTSPMDYFEPVTKIMLGLKADTALSPSLNFRSIGKVSKVPIHSQDSPCGSIGCCENLVYRRFLTFRRFGSL